MSIARDATLAKLRALRNTTDPKGITKGIVVLEVEQNLSKKRAYLAYVPFPTEQCMSVSCI